MKKLRYLIAIILGISSSSLYSQEVVADFSIDQTLFCAPVTVNFNNESEGPSLQYHWDLGNGNTSILENPQAIYTEAGNYTVQLTVWNESSSDSIIIENAITVHEKPVISVEPLGNTQDCAPFISQFTASCENPQEILYQWDFGNGSILEGENISMTFSQAGSYNLLLTGYNENGCFTTKYIENIATAYAIPEFDISSDNNFFCNSTSEVQFDLNYEGIASEVLWDFGDNTSSTVQNPSHTYNGFGSYTVSCQVTDNKGCINTVSIPDMIQISPVVADFTPGNSLICGNQPIHFQNLSQAFSHVEWNFGDGATSNMVNPQHQYSVAGSYTVTLTVWNDDGCENSVSKEITIDMVQADFVVSESVFCQLPAIVEYTCISENVVAWEYHLGNGNVFHEENPTNIITESDMNPLNEGQQLFNDSLIITSALGCTDTIVKTNNIEINTPVAYFTPNNLPAFFNDVRGCAPLTISFNEASIYNNPNDAIISVSWHFGDGDVSSSQNPTHTWTEAGEYEVIMTVLTENGCQSTYSAIVEVGTPQTADFGFNLPDTICASEFIQLFDSSSNSELIDQWSWVYSDGGLSMSPNPSYHFVDTGYMDVALSVGYNGCWSEPFQVNDFIYVNGPVALFTFDYNCDFPLTYTFYAELTEAESWYWDLGDGTVGFNNQTQFTYTYAEAGNYQVKLIAENATNGCPYIYRRTLKPRGAEAIFSLNHTEGCPGLTVQADPSESMYEMPTEYLNQWGKYFWRINQGEESFVSNSGLTYQFDTPGEHLIELIITDRNGCQDTMSQTVRIFGSTGTIISSTNSGCSPLPVDLTANIISDTSIVNWQWSFGDGLSSSDENPSHIYTSGGNYTPTLVITDIMGCTTSLTTDDMIVAIQPNAEFSSPDRLLCEGESTSLIPELQGDEIEFFWTIESHGCSTESNPHITFPNNGLYDVSLHVTDTNGCYNELTKSDYISVQAYPQASFTADTLHANCFPFEVNFQETSEDEITAWHWDFGDESIGSEVETPAHNYIEPGLFSVSLIVETSHGCADSLTIEEYIEVGGPMADIIIPDSVCQGEEFEMHIENSQNLYAVIWDMGNGEFLEGESVSYQYNTPGDYNPVVLLKSDDINTCNKAFTHNIVVPEVLALFGDIASDICAGSTVNPDNTSSGADSYKWNFGDGSESTDFEPVHCYTATGTYNLELNAYKHLTNGSVCSDNNLKSIQVNPNPQSAFTYNIDDPHNCNTPKQVFFTNTSVGATHYKWNFDNNNRPESASSEEIHPSYTYPTTGEKEVQLIAYNEFTCTDTSRRTLYIAEPVHADFRISESQGCEPLRVEFTDISESESNIDPVVSCTFFFGDDSSMEAANTTHTFSHGQYDVTMHIETEHGCCDTITKENAIEAFRKPNADFEMIANDNQENPEGYGEVQFMNNTGGGSSPYTNIWEFGDGSTSTEQFPIHRYASNTDYLGDAFHPELIVFDANGCSDTISKTLTMDYFNGLFVPNAMMPEIGIGEQKLFLPKGKSLISYHLMIYDINGQLVFESSELDSFDGSPTEGWNGKINGQYAVEGTYVWKIEAQFSDGSQWNYKTKNGKKVNTGTLLVIR